MLIVGGNGYIGSEISEILSRIGCKYKIFDNFSGSNPLNILLVNGNAEFIWGDVRRKEDLEKAIDGVDTIIHLAAKLPSTPGILDEADRSVEDVNYFGTINVLEIARKYDLRVVFASTCNVYGVGRNLKENDDVKPLNPYSKSKLKAEKACMEYYDKYGLDVVVLRLASVYGYSLGMRFNLVVNYFVLRALAGQKLTVFGDGSNWRPFIHVHDAARAFLYFAEEGESGEIYNVGSENFTIRNVAEIVRDVVNNVEIEFIRDIKPEFSYSVDFSKMLEAGFRPKFEIVAGIRDLANRLRKIRVLAK